jgi:site-specific recombinase XerD
MRPPDQLTLEHIRQYQLHLTRDRHVAWTYFNQVVCALRFFSREVLKTGWEVRHIPYQKTGRTLPEILSPEEVAALFKATGTLKHRALLMTMYAGGLRASEVTRLRVSDIDRERMVIRIEQGKGRKDRSVMLSPSLRAVLHEYEQVVHPSTVLFPSRAGGGPLSPRSLHRIFQRARRGAQITKHVSPSSLRHACATHLLESGTNLRVIQLLLGHPSLRTTQVYTQVADTQLQATPSPLDRLPNLPSLPPATRSRSP